MTDIPKELIEAVRSGTREQVGDALLDITKCGISEGTADDIAQAIVAERETRAIPTPGTLLKSMFEHGKDPMETGNHPNGWMADRDDAQAASDEVQGHL